MPEPDAALRVAPRRASASARRAIVSLAASFTLWIAPAPARAEVKDATPTGFTIENTRVVPVDAATAFKAVVERVDRWLRHGMCDFSDSATRLGRSTR